MLEMQGSDPLSQIGQATRIHMHEKVEKHWSCVLLLLKTCSNKSSCCVLLRSFDMYSDALAKRRTEFTFQAMSFCLAAILAERKEIKPVCFYG
jgi:hypothetical protein